MTSFINSKFLILGAGLAGLELGRRLQALSQDFVILEKEAVVGGLARTNQSGDYYWDFGVHALYSRDVEIFNYFQSLPQNYKTINRNVKIFHRDNQGKIHLLDYPFEMGIHQLPWKQKLECIAGYLITRLKPKIHPVTREDWIANFSGSGIAKHFMIPYNQKIWSCDLSEVSAELVSLKIEPAPFIQFLWSALGKKIIGRAYQAKFIYPENGIQSQAIKVKGKKGKNEDQSMIIQVKPAMGLGSQTK
jgi:protoporphyrinogen oxidase